MSRRHGASRRRTYAPRQRELRRRSPEPPLRSERPAGWPRGAGWDEPPRPGGSDAPLVGPSGGRGSV